MCMALVLDNRTIVGVSTHNGPYHPGGSAWASMLWAWCKDHNHHRSATYEPVDILLLKFLSCLALWPWPLPWCERNMRALRERAETDPNSHLHYQHIVRNTIGPHLMTSFVVPLPCGRWDWNMTQSVQRPQQTVIESEAWKTATGCLIHPPFSDAFGELRLVKAHSSWPLFLVITLPEDCPPDWRGLFCSRLFPMLIPQLLCCGFHPRPLCVDRPSFVVAIWPNQSLTTSIAMETQTRFCLAVHHHRKAVR